MIVIIRVLTDTFSCGRKHPPVEFNICQCIEESVASAAWEPHGKRTRGWWWWFQVPKPPKSLFPHHDRFRSPGYHPAWWDEVRIHRKVHRFFISNNIFTLNYNLKLLPTPLTDW